MIDRREQLYQYAIVSLNSGNLAEAEKSFRSILKVQPQHVGALNLLAASLMGMGRYHEAEEFIKSAVSTNKNSDVSFYNYGLILKKLGRPKEALEKFSLAISLKSDVSETWNNRGTVFNDLKQYQNATSDFDRAIGLNQNYADAYANKGKSLSNLDRHAEALAAYEQALELKPELAEAWLGRGNVLFGLKRFDHALAAYDKATMLKSDLAEAWLGRGNTFNELKRRDEAFAAYDKALTIKPDLAEAWLARGNVSAELKRHYDAFAAYDKALAAKPDFVSALIAGGNLFHCLKQYDEALATFDKALAVKSDCTEAWVGRGSVLSELKRFEEAFVAYDKALALNPDFDGLEGIRFHTKMHICDWNKFDSERARLISSVNNGKKNAEPFAFLSISSSPEEQIECNRAWVSKITPASAMLMWHDEIYRHDKIRVGYVSADFRHHAVSYLAAGLFESHDKTKFEITAISVGPNETSEFRQRLERAFNQFVDANAWVDDEIAALIRKEEIDILVDLGGFTRDARTRIFALRPAPIQVNYLGYPSTMGADYIDYLMADHTLIPSKQLQYYAEKIVYLPNCYQVNDAKRDISDTHLKRGEFGLPENSFIFCCFNNTYKIIPSVFDCWSHILSQIDGSVLWLLDDNISATNNLKREAAARGIDPSRLVFAPRIALPEHLARCQLADLFLDTSPYNGHTTASDALWAGVPVLTQIGETFAGRVAASLLTAVGLPELITNTPRGYEDLAIQLATNPAKLAAIKSELAGKRLTTPLFNTKLSTRHIEAAYTAMYERYQSKLPPDHIYVSP